MQTEIIKTIKRHIKMLFTYEAKPIPTNTKLTITDSYCTSKAYSDIMLYVNKAIEKQILTNDYHLHDTTTWTMIYPDSNQIQITIESKRFTDDFGVTTGAVKELKIILNTCVTNVTDRIITNVNSVEYNVLVIDYTK